MGKKVVVGQRHDQPRGGKHLVKNGKESVGAHRYLGCLFVGSGIALAAGAAAAWRLFNGTSDESREQYAKGNPKGPDNPLPKGSTPFAEILKSLQSGDCGFGTAAAPAAMGVVQLASLGDFQLPGDLRCPLAVGGIAGGLKDGSSWQGAAHWGDLKNLERHTPATVTFDASPTGLFAYWDNNSLFAKDAIRAGTIRQSYTKVTASKTKFFKALRAGSASAFGFVRYGGKARALAPGVDEKLLLALQSLLPRGEKPTDKAPEASLWLSSSGSYSTAHYDSFENIYVMLSGRKLVYLAPPTDSPLFEVYPGTHPLARQARRHFGPMGTQHVVRPSEENDIPAPTRVLQAEIKGGELLFIPAGWFHHIVALEPSVSASLTILPHEFHEFNSWVQSPKVLPFIAKGSWSTGRLVPALRVFAPALLSKLTAVTNVVDPLRMFVNVTYSSITRDELGMPPIKPYHCGSPPPAKDARLAEKAAVQVANHFAKHFRRDLQLSYLIPYFETIFSKTAGPDAKGVPEIMSRTVSFVQSCLLDAPLVADSGERSGSV